MQSLDQDSGVSPCSSTENTLAAIRSTENTLTAIRSMSSELSVINVRRLWMLPFTKSKINY